jgi:hypothetical protein
MSKRAVGAYLITALLAAALTLTIQQLFIHSESLERYAGDTKDDAEVIQQAIDESYRNKGGLVQLSGNKHYVIRSGLVIKEGVTLQLGQNTKILIDGDFKAIELEKNASIENGILEVVDPRFNSEVIYLDGKHRFWSWERTSIHNVSIINSSGSYQGTAISLLSKGKNNFIGFVNFTENNVAGFDTGISIAVHNGKKDGQSWINGNRFVNMTLDDCVNYIFIDSSVSIPNESSGNQFSGLQIQLSKASRTVMEVNGSYNIFQGMIWDQHLLDEDQKAVHFTKESSNNKLKMNVDEFSINDEGNENIYIK